VLLEEINKLGGEFTEANTTYKRFVAETEDKATSSLNKVHAQSITINKIEKDIELIKKELQTVDNGIRGLGIAKLDNVVYEKDKDMIAKDFYGVRKRFEEITNSIISRDTFVDRILPLKIHTMISDSLYCCIDKGRKKYLAEYE
jgi:hypothetical protein